jgi:tRNA pseudouridine32 synthase/23S rRNA pseudouridine746 synthase
MGIETLYEDDHLIAVSKPSGQVTIPGRGDLPGLPLNVELERHLQRKVFPVHRLDRGASGIVLFAKDAATHRHLSLQFENRQVRKSYWVLAQGNIETGGLIDQPLRVFGSGRMGIHPAGKSSQTEYRVLEKLSGATLLEVNPQTGRRHQIRVHLYSIGHPVMGDALYGKERPVGGCSRLMLHAMALDLKDVKGKPISLRADPPKEFMDSLRLYGSSSKVPRA